MQPAPVFMTQPAQPTGARRVRRFFARHTVFKVGVGVLLFAFLLFFISFIAPAWVELVGLWTECYGRCATFKSTADWLGAARAMEVLALVCFLASLGMELYQDILKSPPPPDNKLVEILALIAMVFHLIGIIVYGAEADIHFNVGYYYNWKKLPLSWGYGLAIAACFFGLLGAFLIAFSRARHGVVGNPQQQQLPTAGMTVPMQTMPTSAAPAGQPGYWYPTPQPYYANGVATTPITGQFAQPPPFQPSSAAGGFPAAGGLLPAYFIETQGRPIPVYKEVPSFGPAVVTSPQLQPTPAPAPAPTAAAAAEPTANQQHAGLNGDAPDASDAATVKL